MGNNSSCSYWGILLLLQLTLLTFFIPTTSAQNNTVSGVGYPSPSSIEKPKFSPFRPSMAVIVGALTTTFSITFLVLLYVRHCKRNSSGPGANFNRSHQYYHYSSSVGRKNSGIDRAVVESLPVFRFGALRAQDELECAVCLNKFECSEVLRLLPKCRHAFHVECVDTWLDAHSTCPLCRFRVDPEDVLLVVDSAHLLLRPLLVQQRSQHHTEIEACTKSSNGGYQRVSGRHSSAGERVFQIVDTASLRRSVDSWRQSRRNKRDSSRKDGLLLSQSITSSSTSNHDNNKTEHRIIVSQRSGPGNHDQRWSDVQPSDLLYLQSEMITSNSSRRFSSGSRPTRHHQQLNLFRYGKRQQNGTGNSVSVGIGIDDAGSSSGGRRVINSRSVSEITGTSRFSNDKIRARNDTNHHQGQDQHAGLLSN